MGSTYAVSICFAARSTRRRSTHVSDQAVRSGLRGTPKAEVIDTVKRDQPRDGCLVDVGANGHEGGGGRVGAAVGLGGGDLSVGRDGHDGGGGENRQHGRG